MMSARNTVFGRGMVVCTLLLVALLTAPMAPAAVWYVNAASTAASPDGQSWATANPTLQSAVDAAASGDEVWVAAGTYTSTSTEVINLRAGVTLYGGYTGTETIREQRDWNANPTVIDGQGGRRGVTAVDAAGVDGFTIQNGMTIENGGGMYLGAAVNCTFTGNTASDFGGGIYGGTALDCTITENVAQSGGGMYGGTATGCTFTANSAGGGGGMFSGKALNCTFAENAAQNGGATYECTAVNCTFTGNRGGFYAGGMSSGTATNCTFTGNTAHTGGGMHSGVATNCTFAGNYASLGGGKAYGTVSNCTFTGNTAGQAGGGLYWGSAVNCTFVGNSATGKDRGDGIYEGNGGGTYYCTTINCTFTGNTAPLGGGTCSGTATNCIIVGNVPSEIHGTQLSFSCSSPTTSGTGNIVGDPRFVNPWAGDFRLRADSPCVDSGTSLHAPATDISDRPRPHGTAVDMGAYEYYPGDDDHPVDHSILRVSAASTAAHPDGLTWETAFQRLQQAADKSGYGGEIWVAAGKYADGGDQVMRLLPNTFVYGGFAGTEAAREQRNWPANATIIEGQQARRCVTANESSSVDGCRLQNGQAELIGGMLRGTAVNCTFTGNTGGLYSGTATNCTFTNNPGSGMTGGTAVNCTFTGNAASDRGGGMCNGTAVNCIIFGNSPLETEGTEVSFSCLSTETAGAGNINGNPGFVNPGAGDCRLRATSPCIDAGTASGAPATDLLGRARPQGAGIDMGACEYHPGDDAGAVDPPPILRVSMAVTSASPDGLTWATAFSTLQAAARYSGFGTEIWAAEGTYTASSGNEVVSLRPGTALYGGFAGTETLREQRDWTAHPTRIDGQGIHRCVTASAASTVDGFGLVNGRSDSGGGMYYGTAANCNFTGNYAQYGGGGMYNGTSVNCTFTENSAGYHGGAMFYGASTNCTFTGNTAQYGGAMHSGTAVNCTFSGNRAGSNGGGMHVGAATNCTFWRNSAPTGGGMGAGTAVNCVLWDNGDETNSISVAYSCLPRATAGEGNISDFPGFVNPWAGDFRLRADSPCVDAGTPAGAPAADLLGRARPQGAGLDMGAYEFHPGDDAGAVSPPALLRVRAASPAGMADGLSWSTAFPTLQEAAERAGEGTEIWVAQGTYTAEAGDQVVQLPPGVSMYGGFEGNETVRDGLPRNGANTIIDGMGQRRCVSANGHVLVDGFTLQNGHSTSGGGMRFGTAANCIFSANLGFGRGGGLRDGAAVNCLFVRNIAGNGGFMSAGAGGGMAGGSAVNCTFVGNRAASASYCPPPPYDDKEDCSYADGVGGGIYEATAVNCILSDNGPDDAANTVVSHSCTTTLLAGDGNIATVPRFMDAAAGDYRLQPGSPCIDRGIGDGATPADIFGVPRPQGAGYDMGAYEMMPQTMPDLSGLARTAAREMAAAAYLYVRGETVEHHPTVPVAHVIRHAPTAGTQVYSGAPVDLVISNGPQPVPVIMPYLVGLARTAARELVVASQLYVGSETGEYHPTVPVDHVIRQNPEDGIQVFANSLVDLVISMGPEPLPVTVPNVVGLARTAARELVVAAQLYVGNETEEYHPTVPADHIVRQNPVAGTLVFSDSPVDLVISKGANPAPAVWYVNVASTAATPDGKSWATAYPCIQPAVDAATDGDTLWVAAGTYTSLQNEVDLLKSAMKLYGGFAGTESVREQRDWTANPTIIDGQGTRRCVDARYTSSTVDGFTLQHGYAYDGAGMYQGTAVNCTFSGNTADGPGGAMHCGMAFNCDFTENRASAGGAMDHGIAVDCTFNKNTSSGAGGGMFEGAAINCTFTGNSAGTVGGGTFGSRATNCIYHGNTAKESGGGMFAGTATNCIIWDNSPDEVAAPGSVSYSCLSSATPGTGNIVADPLFINAASGNFRLQPGSPCIDAGTANVAPSTDIDGVSRPQGAGYDMGVHEMVLLTMPDLSGLARVAARELVVAAQLYVRTETEAYHPTIPIDHVINQYPAAEVEVVQGAPVDLTISKGPKPVPVPDVAGLTGQAATAAITGTGLAVGTVTQAYSLTVPAGNVISQSPAPGTPVLPGTAVDLVVSKGGFAVPDLTGQTQTAASTALTAAGLVVGTVTQQYSATVPVGIVVSQTPIAGSAVLPETAVALVISRGLQPSVMPEVVGQPRTQAEKAITDAGLAVGLVTQAYSETVTVGNVISQSAAAGTELPPGTVVSIAVSLGPVPAAEGEPAEGEGESAGITAQQLAEVYEAADTNEDGALSFDESAAAVPGLTRTDFDALDADADGQLAADELGLDEGSGCAAGCQGGKSAFNPKRLGDLFLAGLGLLGLAAMSTLRRP